MDYKLSDEQQLFYETISRFLSSRAPLSRTRELCLGGLGYDREVWRQGCDLGWSGIMVPEELGGSASKSAVMEAMLVSEAMGTQLYSGPFFATMVITAALARLGSDEQRKLIPSVLSGDTVAAWCVGVETIGSPTGDVRLKAHGPDLLLDGWVDGVDGGTDADVLLVVAMGEYGPEQIVVPTDASGLQISPLTSVDLCRPTAKVHFNKVVVGSAARLDDSNVAGSLSYEVELVIALQLAESVGIMRRVLDFTVEYMLDRVAFGRVIASYQALKHRAADMRLWVEAAAATSAALGRQIAAADRNASVGASVAEIYVDSHALQLIQDCIQIHGGIGLTWEHDLHLYLRRGMLNHERFGSPRDHRDRLLQLLGVEQGSN